MSLAVVYRSDARFDSALRQIRSSSLGIVSSICRGGRGFGGGDLLEQLLARIAPERSSPGQQLVEDHAQAEDVRSPIDPVTLAPGLLGAHVGRRASEPATLAEVLVLERQPEVGDARLARGIDQDVGGLDVPVDQPSGVGVMQGLGDRRDQFRRLPEGRSSLSDPGRQIAALDELGDDEAETVVGAAHVDRPARCGDGRAWRGCGLRSDTPRHPRGRRFVPGSAP